MTDVMQTLEGGLVVASVYVLVGFAWNVVYNSSGFLNLAVGEFYVLGAILDPAIRERMTDLPRWAVLVGAVCIVGGLAFVFERLLLRPLTERLLGPLMVTVGVALILRQMARAMAPQLVVRPEDFFPGPSWNWGGVRVSTQEVIVVGVAVVASAALAAFFYGTDRGRIFRASGLDRDSARAIGINVARIGTAAFVASGVLAATAGLAIAPITGVTPGAGEMLAVKSLLAVSIGGIGLYGRGVIGATVVGVGEAFLARYWSAEARDVIVLAGFVLVLLVPQIRRDAGPHPLRRLRATLRI